jgi:phospholipid/cholesterol/gamma-HCH transport system ATP-binding protein
MPSEPPIAQQEKNAKAGGVLVEIPRRQSSDAQASQRPYLEFKNVCKSFGANKVLDDVSFRVMPGETVCILGRSGVGKSVSLRLIMGFLKPDAGRIVTACEDITDYDDEELEHVRKKVTMVFQDGALFDSLTVGENVAFPLREQSHLNEEQIYQIVDGLLEVVGVKAVRDFLPSQIPTGMKRSVALARALAASPESVLYDEPTTMVDPLMARRLSDLMKRLKFQLRLTSVVVTHDMWLTEKLADHIVFLDHAKAIFFGTMAEMERSPEPVIQQFLKLDLLDLRALLGLSDRRQQLQR